MSFLFTMTFPLEIKKKSRTYQDVKQEQLNPNHAIEKLLPFI